MRAAYFDLFAQGPCWSTDHGHDPGGGSFMYTAREDQIDDLRVTTGSPFVIVTEFPPGSLLKPGRRNDERERYGAA